MGGDYAINAPTGQLSEGLFNALFTRKFRRGQGLAADIRKRLTKLLTLPDEGGWHALTIAAVHLHQLYFIDREWTRAILLPKFDPTLREAEAAWSGFMRSGQASSDLFKDMRHHFLAAFGATNHWTSRETEHLAQHLVLALQGTQSRHRYVTNQEAREALRSANDAVRLKTLSAVAEHTSTDSGWRHIVVPFFRNVWPRDRKFQTGETSRLLAFLLEESGEFFPRGVDLVADFLVGVPNSDILVYKLGGEVDNGHSSLAKRYPEQTLTLLSKIVDENSPRPPYGLAEVMTGLVEACPDLRQDVRWQRLHKLTL
jgi:hypothetical protein